MSEENIEATEFKTKELESCEPKEKVEDETIIKACECSECKGCGGGYADYMNADHNLERGTGNWEDCINCNGTGKEPDDEIVVERIVENLTPEQEDKLLDVFVEEDCGCLDDDMTDAFEAWLCNLSKEKLINILK